MKRLINITDEASYFKVADHLDSYKSTVSHEIKVLRGGEIMEFNRTSSGF